jgi:methylmalonyl-CoA mutase
MSRSIDDRSDVGTAQDLSFTDDFAPISTETWEEKIREDLRGKPLHRLNWSSIDGITLRPFYRSEDLAAFDHIADDPQPLLGADAAPDGAGVSHESAGNAWVVRQDVTAAAPDDAAEQVQAALAGGAEALGVQILAPPLADRSARLGDRGVHISAPDDLETVLRGVDVGDVGIHLAGGSTAAVLFPALIDIAAAGGNREALHGSVEYDPVGDLATGRIADPGIAFRLAADTLEAGAGVPNVRALLLDARPYHNAGGSAVQELAFTLAAGAESLHQLTERGVSLSEAVRQIHVAVPVGTSYFVEIGKLRALRLLLARMLNAFLDADDAERRVDPSDLFVQAHTSRRTETVYGPYVNMLRGTTEAAAAVIGGCDVLTVAPYDDAVQPPGEFSQRIARNTQLILRHESHLDQVADPSAGSYYIEAVTDALIDEAWPLFQEIEAIGGMLEGLASGDIAFRLDDVRIYREDRLERRKNVLVGTTHYPDVDETRLSDVNADDPGIPEGIAPAPHGDGSPSEAVRASGTAPELSSDAVLDPARAALDGGASLRDVAAALAAPPAGGDPGMEPLPFVRLSEPFESLRLRVETYAEQTGRRPTVLLAPSGPAGARSARANFARNFLGVAGFRMVEPISFDTAEDAASAAVDEGADIVVACSSDDAYAEYVPALRSALTDAESRALLVVAGAPKDLGSAVTDAADHFVHRKARLLDTLRTVLQDLGIDAP